MFKNIPNKCYNTEDGMKWFSRSVAVTGIIVARLGEKSYLLLTKRSETMEEMPGRWCLPGGYLDWNETLQDALEREVYEETGINLPEINENLVFNVPEVHISSNLESIRQNIVMFSLRYYDFKDKLPEWSITSEVSNVEWVEMGIDEISTRNLSFGQYEVLQKVGNQVNERF